MATLYNTAEGGAPGTAVAIANSGGLSGEAWDTVVIEASMALTYETEAAYRGNLGYWARGTAAARTSVGWRNPAGPGMRFRSYIYLRQYLGVQFVQVLGAGGTTAGISGYIQLNASGGVFIIDSAGLNHGVKGQPVIPLNTWCRLEALWGTGIASDGVVHIRVYEGDSTTPFITYDVTTANLSTNVTGANFGKSNGSGIWTDGFYFDEVVFDDVHLTEFIGPAPILPDVVRGVATGASGGTVTGVFIGVNPPAGVVAGDQLLLHISTREQLTAWRAPAGWTLIDRPAETNGEGFFYRAKYGTDVTGTLWTFDDGDANTTASKWIWSCVALNGDLVGEYLTGAATPRAVTGTDSPTPAITTTQPAYIVAAAGDRASGGSTWTWPAGWEELTDRFNETAGGTNLVSTTTALYDSALPAPPGTYSVTPAASVSVAHSWSGIFAFAEPAPLTIDRLRIGSALVDALYVGDQPVSKVYVGSVQVWP